MSAQACPLSPRGHEITMMLAGGLRYTHIAKRLGISPSTVRSHVASACATVDVYSAAQLIAVAYAHGWLGPNDTHIRQLEERIVDLTRELRQDHARDRKRRRDALTPGQALYLHSFERWLRDPDNECKAIERALCLRAMYHESSWRSVARGGGEVLPPWEVLGRPQMPQGQRRHGQTKMFRIGPRPR